MEFPDLVFSAYYEFDTNGKITLSIDEASIDKMIADMKTVVTQAVEIAYADEITQTGINVQQVVDGLLAGVNVDSFKQMMGSDSRSTTYRIEGNVIYASMDGEEESGVEFEVSETTLKLTDGGETVELKRK